MATNRGAYICTPDRKIVSRIKGITSFDVAEKGLNDFSTVSFVVPKYITNQSTLEHEINKSYSQLHAFCEIYIPEKGYFIISSEPTINSQGEKVETKEFVANSYESVLQYENLVGFKINQGTDTSVEMNPDNLDELGLPRKMIRLWDEDPDYSLADLILRDDYYGWEVGYVDPTIRTLERAFDVDSQNIYSFLCTDVAQAFRCVVTFDTVSKLINFYNIETYGRNTNIYLSLSHFLESVNISPRSEDIYTVFNVAGENELDISRVNFGSNKIVNIDYPLSLLDEGIQQEYASYVEYRDYLREPYADDAKAYARLMEQMDAIMDRQPMDIIYNNWSSTTYYPTEDLENYLAIFQAACATIEGLYINEYTHEVDMDELNASTDAAMYNSYKYVAIPDIMAELEARAADPPGHNQDPIKADFIFEMYGLNDLEVKQITYEDRLAALREGGYDDEWDPASTISQDTWEEHHAEYLEYLNHLEVISDLIEEKQDQVAVIQQQLDDIRADMVALANSASLEGYGGFTEDQIKVLKSLYRESDYQDSNYGITEIDDAISIEAKSQELFDAAVARLEVESAPQFTWTVSSADLFSMKEFEKLKDDLKVGDFITLGFDTYGIAPIIVSQTEYKPHGIKFRVVEIDYSMINKGANFNIVFSDMTQTRGYRDDFETLLQNAVASKANAISVGASSTAASVAAQVTASIIKPYLEAQNAKLENALITQATIHDLTAINAQIETLVAEYISADIADILHLTVFDLVAAHITSDKSITLVSDDSGAITIANSTMQFSDANGDVRVQIGIDGQDNYSVNIFSEADEHGHQTQLWGSSGIAAGAIADDLIVNDMVNWTDMGAGVDSVDGKPFWNASHVAVDGGRLDDKWDELKTEVASIEIVASSQVIEDDESVTLTPVLHLLDNNNITWSYRAQNEQTWTTVGSTATTTAPYVRNDGVVVVPGTSNKFTVDNRSLVFKVSHVENSHEHSDIMTVFKLPEGSEGYTVILSNEAQTIATTPELYPEAETYYCDVTVYRGRTLLTPTMSSLPGANEYYVTGLCDEQAVTLSFLNPGECSWTFDPTKMISPNFQIELRISIGGFNSVVIKYVTLSAAVAGESPVIVEIDSSAGNIFKSGNISSTLTARVTRGSEDITQECTGFTWTKYDRNGIIDNSWTRETLTPVITINQNDVQNKAIFRCQATY